MHKGSNVIAAVGFKPWRLFDAYRVLIRVKVGRDHNRQAIGKLRKFAVFALFEGLWKALGRCSSPVCRINEKLANTAFASSFFAQKSDLTLILTLIDVYGSAKPIPALFARRAMIPFADLLWSAVQGMTILRSLVLWTPHFPFEQLSDWKNMRPYWSLWNNGV